MVTSHLSQRASDLSSCVSTPVCFTERLPPSCMTTDLIEHLLKSMRQHAQGESAVITRAFRMKVSHWDILSNLISLYPPSLQALAFCFSFHSFSLSHSFVLSPSHSILLPFRPLSLSQTPQDSRACTQWLLKLWHQCNCHWLWKIRTHSGLLQGALKATSKELFVCCSCFVLKMCLCPVPWILTGVGGWGGWGIW